MAISRREFLGRAAAWGGTAFVAGPLAACGSSAAARRDGGPRVAIVGAGLAGLACAHRLSRHGLVANVYEARPDRVGGRCWSAREFAEGQIGEHGGEFIDSDHVRMRALVGELGLALEDRVAWAKRRSGAYSRYYLDGTLRDEDEVFRGFAAVQRRLRRAEQRTGFSGGYSGAGARGFDRLSAAEWLGRNVPGGRGSLLGRAIREYLADEFGLDAGRLSATNLFYAAEETALDPSEGDSSNERFHVHGGNDQVPKGLAALLPDGALHLDSPLQALWRRADGTYGLRLGGERADVPADRVVLAIPFTSLRRVELGRAGLSRLKRRCVEELGMGTNAKLLMQFDRRPERFGHWDGELTSDEPLFDTWDTSLTQPGRSGLLTVYSGGSVGAGYGASEPHGPAPGSAVRSTLAALERAVPGISRDFSGRAWLDEWAADPWAHGSYAAFLPGQFTTFGGVIARREGGIHFAGEQTSVEYQGFLEGAVESGQRCADEVLAAGRSA